MEDTRVEFTNKKIRKVFFETLKVKSNCRTFKQLAIKLNVPLGRLKLWMRGERSLPYSEVKKWLGTYNLKLKQFEYKKFSLIDVLKRCSKKGIKVLKRKYGEHYSRIIGRKGRKKLNDLLQKDKDLYSRWRISIKKALRKKFGKECYKVLGQLGGRRSVSKLTSEQLHKQLEKAFRKSFKTRLIFRGQKFRSKKEIEVALLLEKYKIPYVYEPRLFGYFPDFLLKQQRIVIEVIGFEWQPHIQRSIEKIIKFLNKNYMVVVYTYNNLVDYFKDMPIQIITDTENLENLFWHITGKSSAHPGHSRSRSND